MSVRSLCAAVALAGAACTVPGVTPCKTSSDCLAGGFCREGICVFDDGSGGGSANGGGSAVGGGTAAGGGMVDACGQRCAGYQQCVADLDGGGTCVALDLTLGWLSPAPDATFGPTAAVPFTLSAKLGDGGVFPGAVPFTTDFGASGLLASGIPTGVDAGAAEGPRTAWAGWDGGPMVPVTFYVDATAPTVTLFLQDAGRQWLRNEQPLALLVSTEPIEMAGVALQGVPASEPLPLSSCQNANLTSVACATPSKCACVALDLSAPPLPALNGTWSVDAGVTDHVGNPGSAGAALPVTRVRWRHPGLGGAIFSAPAIGGDGTIYLGTTGASTDRLYALYPLDGGVKWSTAQGSIQSVAVANPGTAAEVVYYVTNYFSSSWLTWARPSDGQGSFSSCYLGTGSGFSGVGWTLINYGGNSPEAVGFATMSAGRNANAKPYAYRATGSCVWSAVASETNNLSAPAPGVTTPLSNCAIDGPSVYCEGTGGRIFVTSLTDAGWGTPVGAAFDGGGGGATFPGLSLFSDGAARRIALGSGSSARDMHFFSVDGGTFEASATGTFVGQVAVMDRGHLWASSDRNPGTIDLFASDGGVTVGPRLLGPTYAAASPVLGKGSLGYVADLDGGLTVFSTGLDGGAWSDALPLGGPVVAGPALDCLRDGSDGGARLGVLYIATTNGGVTAIIVDSAGLDPNAQWPKYQRDATNSGNASLGLPLNPGCP